MKKTIFTFIMGMLSMLVVGVTASALYKATDIEFSPKDSKWNVDNVEDAINELREQSGKFVMDYNYKGEGNPPKEFPYKPNGYVVKNVKCDHASATWDNKNWKLVLDSFETGNIKCVADVYDVEEGQTYEYDYVGHGQKFIVPIDGIYKLEVWGAEGGRSYSSGHGWNNGGKGGYSTGEVELKEGEIIYIYVGGRGAYEPTTVNNGWTAGGFNGGGNGGNRVVNERGGSGGGATDISLYGDETANWNTENHLYSRFIVAGAGAGADGHANTAIDIVGGYGGGMTGQGNLRGGDKQAATAGTQISGGSGANWSGYTGGSKGVFGAGGNITTQNAGAGGGAGWYGGGSATYAPGAGGSGWIYTDSTYYYWSTSSTEGKSGKWKLNSKYYLSNANTISGGEKIPTHDGESTMVGNTGNGYAKITLVSVN